MASMNEYVRKRGSLKASLTNFTKFVQDCKQKEEPLKDDEVLNLQERITRMNDVYIQFNEVQTEIEGIVDLSKVDEQFKERAKFENLFYENMAIAKSMVSKVTDCSDQQSENMSRTSNQTKVSTEVHEKQDDIRVKLPDIPLPKFDGSYERWLEFRDTFLSLIVENQKLTGIQRFHYLRASLAGKAAEVIKSVEFSEQGFTTAWNVLVARFDNKKLLLHNHLNAIFSFEPIYKESSSKLRALIDELSTHLSSIQQLGQSINNWDALLIFILSSKLDQKSIIDWEKSMSNESSPTLNNFLKFLQSRADLLETIEHKSNINRAINKHDKRDKPRETRSLAVNNLSCYFCNENHSIYSCEQFKKLAIEDKTSFVKRKRLCLNCLRDNHEGRRCKMGPCRRCKSWHNTLLHSENRNNSNITQTAENQGNETSTTALGKGICLSPRSGYVFLSTAKIKVFDKTGKLHFARALLDCGSQSSFISADLCETLGLEKTQANLSVLGIANVASRVKTKCQVKIHSSNSDFSAVLTCFILPEVTSISCASNFNPAQLNIPVNLKLADPAFLEPGRIDILIGADLFWDLLEGNKISCGKKLPFLQATKLGWVLAGTMGNVCNTTSIACNVTSNCELQKTLNRFWEQEEISNSKILSKEEIQCETIFENTTSRDSDGRFMVALPLKQAAESLGTSRDQATKRFYSIERKLSKNQNLREYYVEFMSEYESLNHMSLDNTEGDVNQIEYFMPHHGVLRESSITTKLRVVFDASAPSSNGISLNNIQLVGPVLQDDLFSILIRFRKHTFVISADIAKMYRQVLVKPDQRQLQKIFWRSSPSDDLKVYTLNTVTYGHASASFLAIRCLFELANECQESNPEIANIIRHDFYVDDLLTGADSIEHTQNICREISKVLKSGCFELRKWYSNKPEVLASCRDLSISCGVLEFAPDEKAKTLGLTWSCQKDLLLYNVDDILSQQRPTKRLVLSLIAKIFDPLGLLGPCTILAKIFMQRLWSEKLAWDEPLPISLIAEWNQFHKELPALNKLEIKRHVVCESPTYIELHGFADSSEKAYGACLYVRSLDNQGNVQISLLCAKSKVAPIKTLTIPKLELCAALLLARLASKAIGSFKLTFQKCIFWSDSTITLAWLKTSPNLLKIFVSNRVAEIQSLTEGYEWRHVPTHDNPADFLTRGLFPSQISNTINWWQGPIWLKNDSSEWPTLDNKIDDLPELKPQRVASFAVSLQNDFPFERFSSLSRLQRVTAHLLRFKHNCLQPKSERIYGNLTMPELRRSLECLIKAAQNQSFFREIAELREGRSKPSNKISALNPFIDQKGVLRVGGRLKHSDLPFERKYPIILDSKQMLTKLIFEYEHLSLMHPGPQLLLSVIRQKYWPVSGRNLARGVTRKCLRCFRFKPSQVNPVMGDLPRDRVVPTSPFHVTGIDYAGPVSIRKSRRTLEKCYIGVFVCLSTKALHLELITSLSSKSFIQALRRFAARRGRPYKLISDNGTTFVGANRELGQFLKHNKDELVSESMKESIEWSFIPPYSPHFGGLWEAGVKSVKHHLRRVLANAQLSFEEFTTVLCQIEAILNSRPLTPLSSDPQDLLPLTPAHFLIGRPLTAVPDEALEDTKMNRLSRYQLLQRLAQHFWSRWRTDYLNELQQRQKWKVSSGALKEGSLVLIKEEHTSPMEWKMARITQLHPGPDAINRVATLRTTSGIIKRSFAKICPLPTED